MSMTTKLLGLSAGVAAIAAAMPASAQYYGDRNNGYSQPYGYSQQYGNSQPYGYSQQYGNSQAYGYSQPYGSRNYGYSANTSMASQQCSAAVQSRLYNRSSIGGILGAVLGTNTRGQVLSITQAEPRNNGTVRVRGLATSGRYAYNNNRYGAYGVGAYGASGYGYAAGADLSFRCDVGMNGQVYNVSINRR
jgi:hypothetical protein